ncbi:Hypothetical predicted protein [Mytilus galloprovincialis]|uniref:Mab-21-like HhH/H2TH-like domain-containing protein n=1 Tax=Mytilus galloprovincialis TaxID=29158 RepID=A0A8B6G9S9_MYTGA|nr:Hypothetical predicted protein [Mytilus galloprovincialis]
MDTNHTNRENDDIPHMYSTSKITYWEKYGVKRFPYRGKRKYTPLVYQSDDGGIVISNDVFGLTIRQFERMYKDCLDRRKTHESWIMNLRYPDKASNEYLEYLDNCTDCNKECLSWTENDSIENHLVKHLIRTIGTEIDIRKRQLLLILHDKICNAHDENITQISSGSLAEGMDLPGSDVDIMFFDNVVNVKQIERIIKNPIQRTEVFMETDTDHPGFTRLRLIAAGISFFVSNECIVNTQTGRYLSTTKFVNNIKQRNTRIISLHTVPVYQIKIKTIDIACCLRSKYLPYQAMPWILRYRRQWPPNVIIDRIINYGCLVVPIGPRIMPNCNLLWRISFSVAEKQLVHSFNFTQLLCYGLLKLTLTRIVNTNDVVKDLLCSYFMKTALFWVSEEVDIDTFQLPKLFICFTLCLNKLIAWVNNCYCPNYFIPEHNMFLGKINKYNNNSLLSVLNSIKYSGISGLMQNLFHSYPCKKSCNPPYSETSEQSILMLDFLIYRISHMFTNGMEMMSNLTKKYKLLKYIESIQNSESSTFNSSVCKFYYASISQHAAQLLPTLKQINTNYNIRTSYHRHLHDGLQSDAVTGWLLYASFYYATEQYNVTLRLTEYVLSKCLPGMVGLKHSYYSEAVVDNYRRNVHFSMTLNANMKKAVVDDVIFLQHSSLIPQELELEVEDTFFRIPSIIMSHCLRFLCYHHIGDTFNRQQALRHLRSPHVVNTKVVSNTFTLFGVCCEIAGYKDAAFHYYEDALQCDDCICSSAEKRKSRLLNI